jgi:hypothetical protein
MEITMEVSKESESKLPYDPAAPLLGMYLKEYKSVYN